MDKLYTLFLILNLLTMIGLAGVVVYNTITMKKELATAIELDRQERLKSKKRDFKSDYEFLDIHIINECTVAFNLLNMKGVDFVANKDIKIIVPDICKNVYEKLSMEYRQTLLQYYSKNGLYEHIYQRIFDNVMKYTYSKNKSSKVAWRK